MNWARGLFRLWIALSAVWLCVVGLFFYSAMLSGAAEAAPAAKPAAAALPSTGLDTSSLKQVTGFGSNGELISAPYWANDDPIVADPRVALPSRAEWIGQNWPAFAFLSGAPIALTFALGALLLWVGRGFKRSQLGP